MTGGSLKQNPSHHPRSCPRPDATKSSKTGRKHPNLLSPVPLQRVHPFKADKRAKITMEAGDERHTPSKAREQQIATKNMPSYALKRVGANRDIEGGVIQIGPSSPPQQLSSRGVGNDGVYERRPAGTTGQSWNNMFLPKKLKDN